MLKIPRIQTFTRGLIFYRAWTRMRWTATRLSHSSSMSTTLSRWRWSSRILATTTSLATAPTPSRGTIISSLSLWLLLLTRERTQCNLLSATQHSWHRTHIPLCLAFGSGRRKQRQLHSRRHRRFASLRLLSVTMAYSTLSNNKTGLLRSGNTTSGQSCGENPRLHSAIVCASHRFGDWARDDTESILHADPLFFFLFSTAALTWPQPLTILGTSALCWKRGLLSLWPERKS